MTALVLSLTLLGPAAVVGIAAGQEAHAEEAHEESLVAFISRIINFAVLAGGLFFVLRSPLSRYLNTRRDEVRRDLDEAAAMRDTASRQLAEIDYKLRQLPGEIEALTARGAEEIAAEEARIRMQAEAERLRLIDHTTREIDLRVRMAKQELTALAADLAVESARKRLETEMTPSDQLRLVDRYVERVKTAHD